VAIKSWSFSQAIGPSGDASFENIDKFTHVTSFDTEKSMNQQTQPLKNLRIYIVVKTFSHSLFCKIRTSINEWPLKTTMVESLTAGRSQTIVRWSKLDTLMSVALLHLRTI